jgi:hypothetical protein
MLSPNSKGYIFLQQVDLVSKSLKVKIGSLYPEGSQAEIC